MAKGAKPKKPRATKYDEKLPVNRSFIDLIQAAVKDAKKKTTAKKKEAKWVVLLLLPIILLSCRTGPKQYKVDLVTTKKESGKLHRYHDIDTIWAPNDSVAYTMAWVNLERASIIEHKKESDSVGYKSPISSYEIEVHDLEGRKVMEHISNESLTKINIEIRKEVGWVPFAVPAYRPN